VETDTLGVEVGHEPLAGFVSNSPVEFGENAVFTDQTTYDPETWFWEFGDGIGTSDQQNPIYNYSNSGAYTVTLTVANRCGDDVYSGPFEVLAPELFHYVYLPVVVKDSP
jgi:PKD repeat protein